MQTFLRDGSPAFRLFLVAGASIVRGTAVQGPYEPASSVAGGGGTELVREYGEVEVPRHVSL